MGGTCGARSGEWGQRRLLYGGLAALQTEGELLHAFGRVRLFLLLLLYEMSPATSISKAGWTQLGSMSAVLGGKGAGWKTTHRFVGSY